MASFPCAWPFFVFCASDIAISLGSSAIVLPHTTYHGMTHTLRCFAAAFPYFVAYLYLISVKAQTEFKDSPVVGSPSRVLSNDLGFPSLKQAR